MKFQRNLSLVTSLGTYSVVTYYYKKCTRSNLLDLGMDVIT